MKPVNAEFVPELQTSAEYLKNNEWNQAEAHEKQVFYSQSGTRLEYQIPDYISTV